VLSHDDSDENSRILATKLFDKLAPIIGQELCELYVIPQIDSFADDPNSKVRKAVANNFYNLCTIVSNISFKNKLLPIFQKYIINYKLRLSKDSLWTVRKATAEMLPKISSFCDNLTRSTILLEIFNNFTVDKQRYVKIAAIEIFGQFIAGLQKSSLTQSILNFYLQIIDEYYNNLSNEQLADIDVI